MMDNFVTLEFALTFAGMIIMVSLLTEATKKCFDKLVENKTKYVVLLWSFMLCVIAAIWQGDFSTLKIGAETCVIWFFNMVIIWLTAMKAYESLPAANKSNNSSG